MNHYQWLENNFLTFAQSLGVQGFEGDITAHGDKCYSYKETWKKAGIPFAHGVAIYLLSFYQPYSKQVRQTQNGWVQPDQWVKEKYFAFRPHLEKLQAPIGEAA